MYLRGGEGRVVLNRCIREEEENEKENALSSPATSGFTLGEICVSSYVALLEHETT